MRPTDEVTRVFGPYKDGNRWRIVVEVAGDRNSRRFDTEDEANDEKRKLLSAAKPAPKVWDVMRDYFDHIAQTGIKAASVATLKFRLQSFFGLDVHPCELADAPITALTAERCEALYKALATRMAVDTHRNTLAAAKRFGGWCMKAPRSYFAANPLAEVEPIGRRKRGKEQLRVDEARAFAAACVKHAAAGDEGAIAAMTALVLGMRASEVVDRVVRDLDDGGRLLWITDAKTPAGRRTLEVPDSLRPWLLMLARGKAPTDRLFGDRDRHWVLYHVRRMCRAAGVPEVTSHSLRGLHSTIAVDHGATGKIVADQLGHETFAITRQSYVAPGTVERAARRKVSAVLERKPDAGELPASAPAPAPVAAPAVSARVAAPAAPVEDWAAW